MEQQAESIKAAVVHAVAWQEYGRLPALLKRLAALHPTARLLRATGVGFLVADRRLWGLAGTECQILSQKVATKWRVAIKTGLEESALKPPEKRIYTSLQWFESSALSGCCPGYARRHHEVHPW